MFDDRFVPQGESYRWLADVVWLNAGSDLLIAAAFFAIPAALIRIVRLRPEQPYRGLLSLVAVFLCFCAITHVLAVVNVWEPVYRLHGWAKLLTALVSVAAAVWLWRVLPRALAAPSVARLARENEAFQTALARGQQREKELEQRSRALEQRVAELTAALARNAAELTRHTERASRMELRKDRFLSVLAHELRAPLAPIRNAAFLLRESSESERIERIATLIDDQVQQMARLIDDLSDTQRIVSGQVDLRKEIVHAEDVVQAAVDIVEPLLNERRHRLTLQLPEQSVSVEMDPLRIRQVLTHLLTNAASYTEPEGEVVVRMERQNDQLLLSVRDNGIGMEPAQCEGLFTLFARGEHAEGRAKAGLGLGLAVVQRLVELHGGSVAARSDGVGKGSVFTVHLPGVVQEQAPNRPHAAAPDLTGMKVLVVDDHRLSADSLQEALSFEGAQVQAAYRGDEALERARTMQPEFVLLDIELPDANGYEVAVRMRELPGLARVKLIALSGYAETGRADDPFDSHLLKPVELDQITATLARLRS